MDIGKIVKDELGYNWIIRDDSLIEECHQDMVGADINHEKEFLDYIINVSSEFNHFLDVGAHVGYYSIRLAKYFDKIIALEPSFYNHTGLITNIALNNIKNIRPQQFALGNKKKGKYTILERGSVSFFEDVKYDNEIDRNTIKNIDRVFSIKMDEFLYPNKLHNGIIKIDTEGMELDVLKGGKKYFLESKTLLIIEHHESKIKGAKNKIISYLNTIGYKLLDLSLPNSSKIILSNI